MAKSDFKIYAQEAIEEGKRLDKCAEDLQLYKRDLDESIDELDDTLLYVPVKAALRLISNKLDHGIMKINNLGLSLEGIGNTYLKHEDMIATNGANSDYYDKELGRIKIEMGTRMVESDVFEEGGQYGGDQGHGHNYKDDDEEFEKAYAWMQEVYPGITRDQAKELLYHMNHTDDRFDHDIGVIKGEDEDAGFAGNGCGYVALANIIMQEYAGREDEFEKTFGFPYREGGKLNLDRLAIELYTTTYKNGKYNGDDSYPTGISDENVSEVLNDYLKTKGQSASVKEIEPDSLTPKTMKQYIDKGQNVIVGLDDIKIYNMDGTCEQTVDAHWVTVVGVTDDGKIIVSSWGKEYYIKQEDFDCGESAFVIDCA